MTSRKKLSLLGTFAIALLGLALPAFAADDDTLTDADEAIYLTDPDKTDSDGDGLSDDVEIFVTGTNPLDPDTDGDGTNDDVDATPLHAPGMWDGGSAPSHTGAPTTYPYAPSGESATDGAGVYVHSGAVFTRASAGSITDVGGLIRFDVENDSQSEFNGYVGYGWSSILDWKLWASGADMKGVIKGIECTFADDGVGGWYAPDGFLGGLTVDSGVYTWELPNGVKFQFDDADDGRLGKIEDRYGNDLTIAFDVNDRATSMTDARGEQHDFTYYSTGRLKKIAYADGRDWMFFYDDAGNLVRIKGPATTTFPGGITQKFLYTHVPGSSDPALDHNLIWAFDGRGNAWMKNVYDTSDRVVTQTVGSGDYEFDYTDQGSQKVTVTDRVGNERVWTWDSSLLTRESLEQNSNRNVRAGDPTSWDTAWDHDSDGYLTKVTYPRGNGVKMTLNAVKRATERRRKADMSVADSASNDLIHTWTYETSAKFYAVASYTDPEGNETTYTNNTDGRPTTIAFETVTYLDPDQSITNTFTYNADGTVATATDGESKVTDYSYYSTGNRTGLLETVTRDDGTLDLETSYDYTAWGQRDEITDPNGNTTTYTVEAYGNVTRVAAPTALGYQTDFVHDGNLNVILKKVKRIDQDGTALTSPTHWEQDFVYNVLNSLTSTNEDISATTTRDTTFTYDANENRTQRVRAGVRVDYTYDERDLLHKVTKDPLTVNAITKRDYDENGNLETYENARSYDTTYAYDGFDRRTTITNALDHYTEFVYDKNGNLEERKSYEDGTPDVLLAHRKHSYDELNRRWKTEDLLQGTTDTWLASEVEYDKRGLVVTATDRRSNDTTFTYDGARRRTLRTDALGNLAAWTYDDNGNVTKLEETEKIPGSGSTELYPTEFTYDAINRRLTQKVIDKDDALNFKTTTWEYDSLHVATTVTDPKAYETTFEHDALAQITEQSVDLGGAASIDTLWTYDVHDNVTKLEDDNGSDTDYVYDNLNRLTTKTYEDAETVSYGYDDESNLTDITDQNGTDVDQGFDALNRLTGRDATLAVGVGGDTEEDFAYDALNRLTEAKDDDSIVQLTYDSLSRILTEKQGPNPFGSAGVTVSYIWDSNSNLTQIDYPSGFEAHRTYDDINRLTGIEDGSTNAIADFDLYGAGGRRQDVSFGNGATSSYTWDGFRRPTEIAHEDSGSTDLATYSYGWDKNDNPTYEERSHESGSGDVYTYDQANRLTQVLTEVVDPADEVANPGTNAYTDKVAWDLDDVHNFESVATTPYLGSTTTVTNTINSMNEYTAVGATSHTQDKNGNLTDDGTNTYEYDFHNHLIEVTKKSDSSTVAEYAYDCLGRGRRIEKVVGSDTTRFVYHDQHVVEELDGSDDLIRLFAYADGWDNVVMMEAEDVADVDDDANTTELKRFYYHTQLVGSVTQITDEDEVVVEEYRYTPYGETTVLDISSSVVSASQIGNPYGYTARRVDEETGLYYYRARMYSPELGRLTSRDPLEYVDGMSAFAYVSNRPTTLFDPTGLCETCRPPLHPDRWPHSPSHPSNAGQGMDASLGNMPLSDLDKFGYELGKLLGCGYNTEFREFSQRQREVAQREWDYFGSKTGCGTFRIDLTWAKGYSIGVVSSLAPLKKWAAFFLSIYELIEFWEESGLTDKQIAHKLRQLLRKAHRKSTKRHAAEAKKKKEEAARKKREEAARKKREEEQSAREGQDSSEQSGGASGSSETDRPR